MKKIDMDKVSYQSFTEALKVLTEKLLDAKNKQKKTIIFEDNEIDALNYIVKYNGNFVYLSSFEYDLVKDMLNKITEEEKEGKSDTQTYLKMINFLIEENNILKRENKSLKDRKKEIKKILEGAEEYKC